MARLVAQRTLPAGKGWHCAVNYQLVEVGGAHQ